MVLWVSLGSQGLNAAAATLTRVNEWTLPANSSGSANLDLKLLRAGVDPARATWSSPSSVGEYILRP